MVDGLDGTQFLRSDQDDTATGTITIQGDGKSIISKATSADDIVGDISKLQVQSSTGFEVFSVDEDGDLTAASLKAPALYSSGNLSIEANSAVADTIIDMSNADATKTANVSVEGMVESRSGGIKFPDGSVQTTASFAGGIPSGFSILGETEVPPGGFTYTGFTTDVLNHWVRKAAASTPRELFACAVVNGKIYVIGARRRRARPKRRV